MPRSFPIPPLHAGSPSGRRRVAAGLKRILRLTFIHGPRQLLTSRISSRCALMMTLMCSPSLVFCGLLTIPGLIFQYPQQHAYFEFSRVLNADPARWAVLLVAAVCTLLSLALPAAMRHHDTPIRY